MKIQIDIPNNLNKRLKYMKLDLGFNTLKEVIILCIEGYLATYERLQNKEEQHVIKKAK